MQAELLDKHVVKVSSVLNLAAVFAAVIGFVSLKKLLQSREMQAKASERISKTFPENPKTVTSMISTNSLPFYEIPVQFRGICAEK